jgi:hypothetical protein
VFVNERALVSDTVQRENIHQQALAGRLRDAVVAALFTLVLQIPKLLRLRRNKGTWLLFRISLGISGAALVIFPLSSGNNWFIAIGGLVMFTAAVLLPPPKPDTSADRKARELGALVVVNGGAYQPGNGPAAAVRLFVGVEHVWALDAHFQPLLVIPTTEISFARVEELGRQWVLWIRWAEHSAEFSYHGIFAEHLARVAETTVRSVMSQRLPVLPQRRAASA